MKLTQKQRVKNKLLADGFVDNFWCIENKISIRLGAIVYDLKKEGMVFDEEQSGFVSGTKNWRYILKGGPVKPKKQRVVFTEKDGERVAKIEYY